MEKVYDPGTGHAARIAEVEANRKRLREDRAAGLYDDADDAEWYRTQYARLGQEISELRALPPHPHTDARTATATPEPARRHRSGPWRTLALRPSRQPAMVSPQ